MNAIIQEENTQFVINKAPFKLVSVERQISTSSTEKTSLKPTKTAKDELFETGYKFVEDEKTNAIISLIGNNASILSQTKRVSKVFGEICLKFQQLERGEFLYAYNWDKNWFNRVSSRYPIEKLIFGNNTWEDIIARLKDVLSYIEERQGYGYWYPTKRNGKIKKVSLSSFLSSPMKNGNYWSPFIEIVCNDAVTPKMYRDTLGKKVCGVLDNILADVWFQRDFNTMVNFYKGVIDLKRWQEENCDNLCKVSSENNYHLSSFVELLDRIKQCNKETKCIGPSFIGPWSNKWSVLKDWFRKVHGVMI